MANTTLDFTPAHTSRSGRALMPKTASYLQPSHWGELVQGPVRYHDKLVTALITLPRNDIISQASFTPMPGKIAVHPEWCTHARRAARLVLDQAGRRELGGILCLHSNIPLGCGAGSTTADVTATIYAVAKSVGLNLSAHQVQHLDWTIEGAADPLALGALGRTVVYGSRIGLPLRWLTRQLPAMLCLGFNTQPGKMILTEELAARTSYTPAEEASFQRILSQATSAIESGNLTALGRAATDSAYLNQDRLPTPHFAELRKLAFDAGGVGLAMSHSGTVGAILFPPKMGDLGRRLAYVFRALTGLGCGNVAPFAIQG